MKWFGILVFLIGLAFSIYLSLYVMLFGGIVQAINAYQCDPVDSASMAMGIIRAVFFQIGAFPGAVLCFFGYKLT